MENNDNLNASKDNFNEDNVKSEPQKGFRHYFSFKGRIGRLEYFLSYLVISFYSYFASKLSGVEIVAVICIILIIPILWFLAAQGAKRCHDLGHNGWFQLIPLYYLWMLVAPGEQKENEYGTPLQ